MVTWKTSCGTLCHILASGCAAAGQFTLNVQEPLMCYRPNVRKVTPGIHALHHLVKHNFQHTKTHILGPLASIGGILVLRGCSPPLRTVVCGPWVVYPLDFFDRESNHVLIHRFSFLIPWTRGKP